MRTIPGSGPLYRNRDFQTAAGFYETGHIVLPCCLIEIHRKEPTGLISQEWIYPYDVAAFEVTCDFLICDWVKRLMNTRDTNRARRLSIPLAVKFRT